eukprot:TCONS_00025839-protein
MANIPQNESNHDDVDEIQNIYKFYMFYEGGVSLMYTRKDSAKLHDDYVISNNYHFGIMAISKDDEIILNGRILEHKKYSKITSGRLSKDLCAIKTNDRLIFQLFLELSITNNTLCLVIEGLEKNAFRSKNFFEAYFFDCKLSVEDRVSLDQKFMVDLTQLGHMFIRHVSFNVIEDKVLMLSDTSYLIYSIRNQQLIASQDVYFFTSIYWSHDMRNGEFLIYLDMLQDSIFMYTINYNNKSLTKMRTVIQVSDFLGIVPREEFSNVLVRVSSGTSLVMLGYKNVFLIDPFTGVLVQRLKSSGADNSCFVKEIKLNWCSNEVIVFYTNSKQECFGNVFHLNIRHVDTLFYLSLKVLLLNHSIDSLLEMNLPKSIKTYFCY